MENEENIRINKYLSQAGVLSRRKADEAISRGEVRINGVIAVSGDKVSPGIRLSIWENQLLPRKWNELSSLITSHWDLYAPLKMRIKTVSSGR